MRLFIKLILSAFIAITALAACKNPGDHAIQDIPEIFHQNQKRLTEIIIYDVFSPPVASRIYAYTSLAAHEAVRHLRGDEPSIVTRLKGFPSMPEPEANQQYDFTLASCKAFFTVAHNVIFSKDSLRIYEENVYKKYRDMLSKDVFDRSITFGESIGHAISERLRKDNYKETRGMPKYLGIHDDGKWRPTGPDYLEATEPYWFRISALSLDSCNQFDPGPPPAFSKDSTAEFYRMNKEVCDVVRNLSNEQKDIAYFWDDNPFVFHHAGHMMFNTKKQTPGGHWMGITAIACRKTNADAVKTARAYALVAVGLLDAFISCWDTKYRYQCIRPITVINEWMDKGWEPYLQTPPFPEYTSGHSTISGAASTILTGLFGENFAFHDDADKEYIGMERDFKSFKEAAQEASISRLYGGIHYRVSLDVGLKMGEKVGRQVLKVAN